MQQNKCIALVIILKEYSVKVKKTKCIALVTIPEKYTVKGTKYLNIYIAQVTKHQNDKPNILLKK